MKIFQGYNAIFHLDYDSMREDKDKMSYVTKVTVKEVRIHNLVEMVYQKLDPKNNLNDPVIRTIFNALPQQRKIRLATSMSIFRYCIHRILTHFKLYTPEVWNSYVSDDYYSQEVSAIVLKEHVAINVDNLLNRMAMLDDSKRVELMLQIEYGKVIPLVMDREWQITTVHDVDELNFTNQHHYEECMSSDLSYLENYKLPRALCIYEGTKKYRVIDGYHRLCGAIKHKKPFLIIYCNAKPRE